MPLPRLLATYMAMSALRSSWASSTAWRSSKAMPMLARMVTCPPTSGNGAPRVVRTRWASIRAVSRSLSSARMANSVLELGGQGVALAQGGPQHALGAAQLTHGGLVLADQVGHPDQHQQEEQGAAGDDHRDDDHRDVDALV